MKQKLSQILNIVLVLFLVMAYSHSINAQKRLAENKLIINSSLTKKGKKGGLLSADSSSTEDNKNRKAQENINYFLSNREQLTLSDTEAGWLNSYATAYYSKWQAEENQTNLSKIGVKHKYGKAASWKGVHCWSTLGINGSADSLIYGPHYYQAKEYKRKAWGINIPQYSVRFRMALDKNHQKEDSSKKVCTIKAVLRYAAIDTLTRRSVFLDTVFLKRTLTVSDFYPYGRFKYFSFDSTYRYPFKFRKNVLDKTTKEAPHKIDTIYADWLEGCGIEFCVDWLGNKKLGTLYVDYSEVYDNTWVLFLDFPGMLAKNMKDYIKKFLTPKNADLLEHFKPNCIDAIMPIQTIDSLIHEAGNVKLITSRQENASVKKK